MSRDHNTPVHGIEIHPNGDELYVTSVIDNKIYVYDLPGCELSGVIQTGNWPQLTSLFGAKNLHSNDTDGYTAAASLVDYLLSRGDKETLLAFAAAAFAGSGCFTKARSSWLVAWTSRGCAANWRSPNRPGRGGSPSTEA